MSLTTERLNTCPLCGKYSWAHPKATKQLAFPEPCPLDNVFEVEGAYLESIGHYGQREFVFGEPVVGRLTSREPNF